MLNISLMTWALIGNKIIITSTSTDQSIIPF